MNEAIIHFCTENPCPVREKEIFEILNNGCSVIYSVKD